MRRALQGPEFALAAIVVALVSEVACVRAGLEGRTRDATPAAVDSPRRDRSRDASAPGRDGPLRPDGCNDQLPLRDAASGCLVNGCVECEPAAIGPCAPCCRGDCDGLPDSRDPWTLKCNQLWFSDDFCTPVLSKWNHAFMGSVGTLGLLRVRGPVATPAWLGAFGVAQSPLIETRLGSVSPQASWELWVVADADNTATLPPQTYRSCRLTSTANGLYLTSVVAASTGEQRSTPQQVPPAVADIVVQSWLDGSAHLCRVAVPDRPATEVRHAFSGSLPSTNRDIAVGLTNMAQNVEVTIDWVRVFLR